MKHTISDVLITDAGNHRVEISRTNDVSVKVGSQLADVIFYVVDKLGADVVLGSKFCDKNVEAIRPRRRVVELDDDTTICTISDAIVKTKTEVPIPDAKIYAKHTRKLTNKTSTGEKTRLEPEIQT